ncbi:MULTISPECIES: DNA mismatch repair endonuclease MutL [Dictyoglomus]|jgi:DNA mismatch repair protein MutL|uniref:DNA mismatch repair endonuclease MutL n=1 Tax=Dictyoglomus TaxID=13 RepID=UPI0023574746|nr:DNA mismatch repair endonuclease MutL [Dictyoglomus turgidum]
MGKVILLPEEIRNKIAAGEVIERPVSVVKELVENSIDAGAKRITVEFINGGETLISVIDDGEGMTKEDAILALNRFATSKIKTEEDLYNIKTLGFRGEALASIASVSKVEVRSKTETEDGVFIKVEGGVIQEINLWQGSKGTVIKVFDLFYNVPARRKFLKSKTTETNLIVDFVKRIAMAYPEISFQLIQDGKNKFITSGNGKLEDVVSLLFDIEIHNNLIFLQRKEGNYIIEGFISKPGKLISLKSQDYFYVNRRWVRNNIILQAIKEGYKNRLLEGYFPFSIVFLTLPYHEVDVNVHPTKREIKFEKEKEVYEFVSKAIKEALDSEDKRFFSGVKALEGKEHKNHVGIKTEKELLSLPMEFEHKSENKLSEDISEYISLKSGFRIVGQIFDNYIIVETKDRVYIIDQHAAHERIRYEELKKELSLGYLQNVEILFPLVIEVSEEEKELLNKHKDLLEKFAFSWEDFGPYHIRIIRVPYEFLKFDSKSIENLFREIISDISEKDLSKLEDKIIKSMACHSAIRSGNILVREEMEVLINLIFERKIPLTCPHGRPYIWEISKEELERYFHRR